MYSCVSWYCHLGQYQMIQCTSKVCLGFITGAGGSPRRLGFSCICAARVPVSPAVDAVPLCLVPWWYRVRCDVLVTCLYSGLVVLQRYAIVEIGVA